MPGFRALTSALAAAACAAGLSACGDDDEAGPIPADQGNQLIATLDEIEAEVQEGDCDRARELAVVVAENVSSLPIDDAELRDGLVAATRHLEELTEDPDQCTPDTGATGETGTLPTEPTTTTTTEPTTTTTTTEESKDNGGGPPDQPPGGGKGDPGGGNGNDDGGGTGGDDSSGGIGSDG